MDFVRFAEQLVRLRTRRTGGLIVVEQVDSTQHLGRRIIDEYAREGSKAPEADILAWCQTSGHGRQGRPWSSPPGHGVYVTLVRSLANVGALQTLPLRTAVASCELANRYLDGRCRLKWPNDLLVADGKLAGILIEAANRGDETTVATIGVGFNYGGDLAAFGEARATSLVHESAAAPPLPELATELVETIHAELYREASTAEIVARYEELAGHETGDVIRVRTVDGIVEGRFLGFDENAFLRLDLDGEERRLSTGEILRG